LHKAQYLKNHWHTESEFENSVRIAMTSSASQWRHYVTAVSHRPLVRNNWWNIATNGRRRKNRQTDSRERLTLCTGI